MSEKSRKDFFQYVLLIAIVLVMRLPFIGDGYGIDGDSWSLAINAKQIHDTGTYSPSRLPGFPVHEFLCSLFAYTGYQGLNLISVIFSVVAVIFFAKILKVLRFRMVLLASIAFAAVPVFYIHSTTTIDYVPALAFILGATYFLLRDKLILAGIFIGLAVGTRITSGAMLVPLSILIANNDGIKNNIQRILRFVIPSLFVSTIFYVPLLKEYGMDFFTYYNVPYPSIPKVLYKFSIEVWGIVGISGIIISTALLFFSARNSSRRFLFPRAVNEKFVISWLVAIDLYIIAFLKLPMESGYLIPIIPFVIFLFGKYLHSRAFVFFCMMLIASSLICTISPRERFDAATPSFASFKFEMAGEELYFDVLKGPVMSYETRRKNGINFVESLIESADTITSRTVLVAGKWYNQLVVQCKDTAALKFRVKDYLNEDEAVYFYAKGFTIYYLPKQDFYNKIMRNVDLDIYRAEPYIRNTEFN